MDNRTGVVAVVLSAMICIGLLAMTGSEFKRREGLLADSLAAARDTTRRVEVEKRILGDSNQLLQRRIVQTEQRVDALDRSLKLERRARMEVVGQARPVQIEHVATGPVVGDTGVRRMRFLLRHVPYRVFGVISVPAAPAPGMIDTMIIVQDSVPMDFRIQCGARNAQGIRAADLSVKVPVWFDLQMRSLQQDPEVCNPRPRPSTRFAWMSLRALVDRFGVTLGYGLNADRDGNVRLGPNLSASFRVF